MKAISLHSEQNDLIRRILEVKDISLLEKIRDMLIAEEKKANIASEDSATYMTRQEIESHLAKSCEEVHQIREGKIKPINAEDLLKHNGL